MEYYKVLIWLQCNNSPVMMKIMGFYWPKQIVIQLMIISQHSKFHTVPPKIYRIFYPIVPVTFLRSFDVPDENFVAFQFYVVRQKTWR